MFQKRGFTKKVRLKMRKNAIKLWQNKEHRKAQTKAHTRPTKNGRRLVKGYIYIYSPNHPNKNRSNCVAEHRLVMEAYLNKISLKKWVDYGLKANYLKNVRFLTKEKVVHHINGKRNDNRIKNLILFPNKKAHENFRHLNKKTFICKFCGKNQS